MTLFLTPKELVDRYRNRVSLATLEGWRTRRVGPQYIKIQGAVMYRLVDIEEWEMRNLIKTDGKSPRTIATPQKALDGME